jgi:hypothetical protein
VAPELKGLQDEIEVEVAPFTRGQSESAEVEGIGAGRHRSLG